MRDCLILGTGRSGTSMMAGILDKSGWYTGDNYLAARDTNPAGFYEDRTVNRLNDRILQTGDHAIWVRSASQVRLAPVRRGLWLSAPSRSVKLPLLDRATIGRLVANRPFAYKDPRFCHTYPVWSPFLPLTTLKLVVFREPGRTVASILREGERYGRLNVNERDAESLWGKAYRNLLKWADHGWQFVHFDQVLDGSAFPRLEEVLNAPLDRSHVDAQLKRSLSRDTAGWVRDVYHQLCDAAGMESDEPT